MISAAAALYPPPGVAAEGLEGQADKAVVWPPPGSGAKEMTPRTPRYPLKTARTLTTDAEIAQARDNIKRHPAAKQTADKVRAAADDWLKWTDADLARLLAPASVPRAFDVGASVGCPKCGQEIHEKFGTYPWKVDLRKPFKLTCPVDGSVYPDNDYAGYLASGFKEKPGWDKPVVDDGWGWLNPKNGERYWFVAHWNHYVYHRSIAPALVNLSQAYLLTGDRRYAHKAAVILHRLAEVYPAMDHEKQSRYGLLSAQQGRRYPGKVLNHIWETNFVTTFTQAYDAVWETLDGDTEMQRLTGKGGRDLRAFIEANLLEDAVDAYYSGRVVGNFGMHQSSLAHLAAVRQHGDTEKWIGSLLTGEGAPADTASYLGIEYALYDLVFRDGTPSESAPGYNFLWVAKLTELARLLQRSGMDLFATEPRLRLLYDAVIDIVNARRYTPALGDSGSVWGDTTNGRNADVFLTAARAYKDDRYAGYVAKSGTGETEFATTSALYLPAATAVKADPAGDPPLPPRLLDGSGVGILCDPADKTSVTLTYGHKAGHGHFDRMNFELFAAGVPLMPDLGYPDAMNDYVSGIYTWSKNTISHNTVTVDAGRQTGNVPGKVRLFAAGPFARVLGVDAAGTYPQTTAYGRTLVMVDAGAGNSYLLDVFDVSGGKQHDYSLHGPPGEYAPQGDASAWTAPEPGTLAGRDVPLGHIYDAPKMAGKDYKGGYSTYTGSGFQHLEKVRRHKAAGGSAECLVEWRHAKEKNARLRVRILPQPDQEIVLAQARVSPVKVPDPVGYLIARRRAEKPGLKSRFVSVIEPLAGAPFLAGARAVPLAAGEGTAVEVTRTSGDADLILHDPAGSAKRLTWGGDTITTDARTVVLTRGKGGRLTRVFIAGAPGGCTLKTGERTFSAKGAQGKVASIDPKKRALRVEGTSATDDSPKPGTVAFLVSGPRRAAFTVATAARGADGVLSVTTQEDLLVGRTPVKAVSGTKVTSGIPLPLASTYAGAALFGEAFGPSCGTVASATGTELTLAAAPGADFPKVGEDVYLAHAAPGDRWEVPAVFAQAL